MNAELAASKGQTKAEKLAAESCKTGIAAKLDERQQLVAGLGF